MQVLQIAEEGAVSRGQSSREKYRPNNNGRMKMGKRRVEGDANRRWNEFGGRETEQCNRVPQHSPYGDRGHQLLVRPAQWEEHCQEPPSLDSFRFREEKILEPICNEAPSRSPLHVLPRTTRSYRIASKYSLGEEDLDYNSFFSTLPALPHLGKDEVSNASCLADDEPQAITYMPRQSRYLPENSKRIESVPVYPRIFDTTCGRSKHKEAPDVSESVFQNNQEMAKSAVQGWLQHHRRGTNPAQREVVRFALIYKAYLNIY